MAVITQETPDRLSFFRWGLIPFWAKDLSIGNKTINAKAESLFEKPSFRIPAQQRHCLIPADSFYEWQRSTPKTPYRFLLKDECPFAMAGIWDVWKSPSGEEIRSFSIITTCANSLVANVHHRMPVILPKREHRSWLESADALSAAALLQPFPAEQMQAYPISTLVNTPNQDHAGLHDPVGLGF